MTIPMPFTTNTILGESFHEAWLQAIKYLSASRWESRNLVVQISHPEAFHTEIHQKIEQYVNDCNKRRKDKLLTPKQVAYTIFPHELYERKAKPDAGRLFELYNRDGGFYQRVHYLKPGEWGTYFRSMTHYQDRGEEGLPVNQIQNAITSLRDNPGYTAARAIHIEGPTNNMQLRGRPCLNYIAFQNTNQRLGMLAVYRNHDFLNRAYGNYWGLCNLLMFIAEQINKEPGPLTCISSHAYVGIEKRSLVKLVRSLIREETDDT